MSKHSPTVLSETLVGARALAVPVANDPMILERTVNHVIYTGNGKGNGNGNGNGHNGTELENASGSFLYDEQDLSKIVFPVGEHTYAMSAEPERSQDSADPPDETQAHETQAHENIQPPVHENTQETHEPVQQELPSQEQAAQVKPFTPDQSEKTNDWEQISTGTRLSGLGAMLTPMAAGAAHALASLGAHAGTLAEAAASAPAAEAVQSGVSPEYVQRTHEEAPAVNNGDELQDSPRAAAASPTEVARAAEAPPAQGLQGDAFATSQANTNSEPDFFAGPQAQAAPQSEENDFDSDFDSGSGRQNSTEQNAARSSFDAGPPSLQAAPGFASEPAPAPESTPVPEPSREASHTSAHASSRPGMMDFFSATAGGATHQRMSNAEAATQGSGNGSSSDGSFSGGSSQGGFSSSAEPSSATFMSGSQASIIQNAIQAAASLTATSTTTQALGQENTDPAALDSKAKKGTKKSKSPGSGSATKKGLRPAPSENSYEDESSRNNTGAKSKKKARADDTDTSEKTSASRSKSSTSKSASRSSKSAEESQKQLPENLEIMGFSLPTKFAKVGAILILFVGFPVIVLVANLSTLVSGIFNTVGGKQEIAAASASTGLSGQWDFAYENPGKPPGTGIMVLQQNGSKIEGHGRDKAEFQISGSIQGDQVTFNKQYVQQGQVAGKPILYSGKIDFQNNNPTQQQPYFMHMSGVWQFKKREGFSWRAQIVQLQGRWEAGLSRRGQGNGTVVIASGGGHGGGGLGVPAAGGGGGVDVKDPKQAHDFFMKVALGIIATGVVLAMASLKFFGPSGLLNIWAKKEYIPSQFKSQHFKMVAEMGKGLRPGGVPLGTRKEWGIHQFWRPRTLNLPPDLREQNPHTLILGAGAKGKSRLMASMISNDIESADRAVVVVDSDGALIDLLMNWIAAHPKGKQMAKRVVVIDPTYDGETICYNPLEFPEDGDLQNAASSVVFGFKAIYTEPPGSQSQWNQQTANILRNAAVLLMANGQTLTHLPVLLSDNDYRDILLEKVEKIKHEKSEYTTLVDAWTNYKRLARTDQWINWIEPILNRVQPMLGDPRIRPILTKTKSDLILQDIIKQKKVLFVKIPQGQLDQNGNLLGSLMVTGIKQAALSLSVSGKEKKRPCALYLDEFDTFIEKETFDAITSETRKFQIGFCGASKTLQTLPEDYRNQLIINVGLMAIFALAKKDGDMLGPQMFRVDGRKVKHQTIQNVFNKVNTSPQFELISDEEKLNIDRVVGQEERTYFCYRVGTVAGVFNMMAPEFKDVQEKNINYDIIDQMYGNRLKREDRDAEEDDDDDE